MCTLMPVPYLHQFSIILQKFNLLNGTHLHYIWCKFSINKEINARTAYIRCAWEEFREQQQNQSIKKAQFLMLKLHYLVQMGCRFNAHISWVYSCFKCYKKLIARVCIISIWTINFYRFKKENFQLIILMNNINLANFKCGTLT